MKQLITLIAILALSPLTAQISLYINGEEAVDGQQFIFHETGDNAGIEFYVTNMGDNETWTNVKVMEINNNTSPPTNGNEGVGNVQFCWGICYLQIILGNTYPSSPEHLDPGASTAPEGNHFINYYEGDDPQEPVSYVFEFRETDASGNVTGNTITITYIYEPNTAVTEVPAFEADLYPNPATHSLHIRTGQHILAEVLDHTGRTVLPATGINGDDRLDLEGLTSGIYYVRMTDDNGNTVVKAFIKQ